MTKLPKLKKNVISSGLATEGSDILVQEDVVICSNLKQGETREYSKVEALTQSAHENIASAVSGLVEIR